MGEKASIVERVYNSQPVQIVLALVIYAVYASVLGAALAPSAWLLATAARPLALAGWELTPGRLAALAGAGGASVFLYFIWGSMVMAALIRLLTLGLKPGKYPKASVTTLRWLIQSGIHCLAMRSILPYIPVSCFSNLYFKIIGAKIGKNVYINTNLVSDAYLLTLEDGVILGGDSEVTCHLMEREHLILSPIRIGKGSLIGTGAYISPGVDVGERCTVGARCYIRRGVRIPDGSVLTVLSGLPARKVHEMERVRA